MAGERAGEIGRGGEGKRFGEGALVLCPPPPPVLAHAPILHAARACAGGAATDTACEAAGPASGRDAGTPRSKTSCRGHIAFPIPPQPYASPPRDGKAQWIAHFVEAGVSRRHCCVDDPYPGEESGSRVSGRGVCQRVRAFSDTEQVDSEARPGEGQRAFLHAHAHPCGALQQWPSKTPPCQAGAWFDLPAATQHEGDEEENKAHGRIGVVRNWPGARWSA